MSGSYGLISVGRGVKRDAMQGLEQVAQQERERDMRNDQLEMAEKQQKATNVSAGAGIGASMAAGAETGAFAGPMGMLYGAALGALAGWATGELF
ncbi:hypothetical protein [Microbulbifer sp. 2201CG32-9]|uniref:hypothetical protein n=1 Tax=unclassified Microbulbifer TaxID=2619833 RepID=UPI00345B84D8